MKNNKWVIFAWGINLLIMLVIIIFPKSEEIFHKFYYIFLLCLFVVPLLLNFILAYELSTSNNFYDRIIFVPSISCSLMMMFTFIKFVQTISKSIVPQFVTVLITFVLLETFISYGVYTSNYKRKYLIGCLFMYITLILFFFIAMMFSYDHSIIW